MRPLPAGWTSGQDVEVVPSAYLVMPGQTWPPSNGESPAGTATLAEWAVDRELVGSLLPGQVRGGSGASVASGSVSFPQPADSKPLAPWGRGAARIVGGTAARLTAGHDGPQGAVVALGAFVVDKISGSNASGSVEVDLVEDSASLRRPVALPPALANARTANNQTMPFGIDAAWIIDQAARAGGYHSTQAITPETVYSMPLVGAAIPERGTVSLTDNGTTWRWVTIDGLCTLEKTSLIGEGRVVGLATVAPVNGRVWLSIDMHSSSGMFQFAEVPGVGGISVTISPSSVSIVTSGPATTVGVPPFTGWATISVGIDATAKRVYTAVNGGTVSAANYTGTSSVTESPLVDVRWTSTATRVRGVRVIAAPSGFGTALPWAARSAVIAATESPLTAVLPGDESDGWGLIQAVTGATFGGAWITEDGTLVYRNRHALRGIGTSPEKVVAEDALESLDWTLDPGDVADSLELTFQPSDEQRVTDQSITVWESTEVVTIGAGKTVTLTVDVEGAVDSLAPWQQSVTGTETTGSRWAASTQRDGGGTMPPSDALSITNELVSATRVRLRIRNNTSGTLYTAGTDGTTQLTLRANLLARPGEAQTVAFGASAEAARSPLTVDAGAYVQDEAFAEILATWVWSQVQSASATVERVRVVPHLGRQIGDVIVLTDGITELRSKAIITGVHNAGSAGGYTQHLDLALLDVTFDDLDVLLAIATFNTLDARWAGLTFAALDEWIDTEGVPS